MAEINESSLGLDAVVTFLKADGSPAVIDGFPVWTLGLSEAGNAVASLEVDAANPFRATITPLPVAAGVAAAHSAQGSVSGDADLDTTEQRQVVANFVVTVRRDEAQSAGVTLTEITAG